MKLAPESCDHVRKQTSQGSGSPKPISYHLAKSKQDLRLKLFIGYELGSAHQTCPNTRNPMFCQYVFNYGNRQNPEKIFSESPETCIESFLASLFEIYKNSKTSGIHRFTSCKSPKMSRKLTRFPRSLAVSGTNPGHMSFLRGTQWAQR